MEPIARRLLLPAAAVAALLLPSTPATAQVACPGAHAVPSPQKLDVARGATLCLLNAERRNHGIRPLRPNARLRAAAHAYSREMVRHRFFDHVSPVTGSTLSRRVKATRYLRAAAGWRLGENLAWGSGTLASPARTVAGWMRSPGHRQNILNRGFREIGIGIVPGAPSRRPGALGAATYTTDFGARG